MTDATGQEQPLVDVVIALHDLRRPIARAVDSVLGNPNVSGVRVTVVCHGLDAADVRQALQPYEPDRLRLVEFSDGVRSAAGPFNRGLELATADYVSVMGSDDFLEAGAMSEWVSYLAREKPDIALIRLRHQGGATLHNPLARARRTRNLDPVRDRVFYRTAPLGLIRRAVVDELGLRMTEGFRTGEDLAFGVRLWTSGRRMDYLRSLPAYVIGGDADVRVTTSPMSVDDFFAPVHAVLTDPAVSAFDAATKRSLAVKLTRIHLLGYVLSRPAVEDWDGAHAVSHLRSTLLAIDRFAPDMRDPFSRADRDLLDVVSLPTATTQTMVDAVAAHRAAGRVASILPRRIARAFDRESVLSRYLLYALSR